MRTLILSISVAVVISAAITAKAQEPEKAPAATVHRVNLQFLQTAYEARTKPDAQEWKSRVHARERDLAASLQALIATDQGAEALQFVVPFAYFLSANNQQNEALNALDAVLRLSSAQAATAIRARALYDAGLLAFRKRDQEKSRALNQESLEIARRIGEPAAAAMALIGLSRVALRAHDFKTVNAYAQEAADIRAKLGNESGRSSAMHMVAAAARMSGDDARAQTIYESTLATYRAAGQTRSAAGELFNLGYVHLHQNHVAKAAELFKEGLEQYRLLNDDAGIAYCLTGFAALASAEKQPLRSAQLYGASAAILERLGITLDPDDQLDVDRYSETARRQLDDARYDAEYSSGRALARDRAIELALSGK